MTTPTIVITVEGGVIQDISVSHQACVVVIDLDTQGADRDELIMIDGESAFANKMDYLPSEATDVWIAQVLADIEKDERP